MSLLNRNKNDVYHALRINLTLPQVKNLFRGKGVRISKSNFRKTSKKPKGFVIHDRHYARLVKVITHDRTYTLRFDQDEIEINMAHPFHGIKVGSGFFDSVGSFFKNTANKVVNAGKSLGKTILKGAKNAIGSKYGQLALKGLDLLGASELGVPPGIISGLTNTALGIGEDDQPEEQEIEAPIVDSEGHLSAEIVPDEDYEPLPQIHPKTGRTYTFPSPPSRPNGEAYTNANPPPISPLPKHLKTSKHPTPVFAPPPKIGVRKSYPPLPAGLSDKSIPQAPPLTGTGFYSTGGYRVPRKGGQVDLEDLYKKIGFRPRGLATTSTQTGGAITFDRNGRPRRYGKYISMLEAQQSGAGLYLPVN